MPKVRWYQNILIIFCFFVYFFPFKAYGFDPRLLVFLFFFIYMIKDGLLLNRKVKCRYIKTLFYPVLMSLFTVLSSVVNTITENTFIIFPFQVIYLLLLSYCIYYITKRFCKVISFYVITRYFLMTLVVQSVIAIVMFVNQPICLFLFDLQGIDLTSRVIKMYFGVRLIGLGCFYFGAGAIYGLGLIAIMPFMLKAKNKQQLIKLILLYVYIFIVGIFFARTAMIGCVFSIVYLIFCILIPKMCNKVFLVFRQFIIYLTVFGIALVFIYTSSPKLQEDYGDIIDFGFEAFINLVENGELSTASSDGLTEYHLSIWPQNQKTYYIGDMRWTKGDSYYSDSDVGYVRLLFYFGVPGVILFLLYQYSIVRISGLIFKERILSFFFFTVFFYALILLIKGYIDVASLIFIYLHYKSLDSKYENRILC
ncbi:hypothetical protein DXC95_18880 [Parabacteroides sp. 20_3]|jgi:hypothetical protein|nr:hypothetical protein DXC95_18880 [Parabacteroides sp. 20_3]